jgi:recombination protein RecA
VQQVDERSRPTKSEIHPTMAKPATPAKPATDDARMRNLDLAVSAITKQFGEGSIMRLGSATKMQVQTISTGSLAIDLALGVGGLPMGRMVEVFGPESSGKTTFCLSVIAEAQRRGGLAAFVDVEHALDPKYARVVGVKLDELLVSQPDSGEDALNITETLIRSNAVDVIVLDSVAALVSKQELDGQMGDSTVGVQARLMSQAMRRLTAVVSKTQCVCIFTNQIREKIGVMFGNPETTPGGRALKFFSSIRIDIRRIGQIKDPTGRVTGNRTKIKVVKNKVAPPFTECEFDIMYNEGISRTGSLLDLGIEQKILEKKGAWIAFQGNLIGQGREAAKQYLAEHADVAETIGKAIMEKVQVSGGTVLGTGGGNGETVE